MSQNNNSNNKLNNNFEISDIDISNTSDIPDSQLPDENLILKFILQALNINNGPYFKNNLNNNLDNISNKNIIKKNQYPVITICYVSNSEMQEINNNFRDKNKHTNILSFTPTPPPGITYEAYLGDLVLAPDVISQEAKAQNKDLYDHYAHLFIHGVLHLKGYDHIKDNDAKVMEELEISLLNNLSIKNPYLSGDCFL